MSDKKIKEQIHEVLRSTWARNISVDDASDKIESLFLHVGEMTIDPQGCAYVALDDCLIEEFEDGSPVFAMIND